MSICLCLIRALCPRYYTSFVHCIIMQITLTMERFCLLEKGPRRHLCHLPGTCSDMFTHGISTLAQHFRKTHHKSLVPQMKEEFQTFQVECFWHLATPRSLFQIFNGVDCGESSCLGSLLLASSAEGPAPPLFRLAAWLYVAANHNGNNSGRMGHMRVSTFQNPNDELHLH